MTPTHTPSLELHPLSEVEYTKWLHVTQGSSYVLSRLIEKVHALGTNSGWTASLDSGRNIIFFNDFLSRCFVLRSVGGRRRIRDEISAPPPTHWLGREINKINKKVS